MRFLLSLLLSLLLFFIAIDSAKAQSYSFNNIPRYFYLQAETANYRKTGADDTALTDVTIRYVNSVEFGMRLKNIFSLGLLGLQSTDHTLSGWGLGFRVDVPGFFLWNAKDADFSRIGKKYPVNTSLYGFAVPTSYFDSDGNLIAKGLGMKFGFEVDIFLLNRFTYMSLSAAGFNYLGRSYMSGAAGLGFQF